MKTLTLILLVLATTANAIQVVETVEGLNAAKSSHAMLGPIGGSALDQGTEWVLANLGVSITRLTDIADVAIWRSDASLPPQNMYDTCAAADGDPAQGFHNGYCKYTNLSADGQYLLAYWTRAQLFSVYRVSDLSHVAVANYNLYNGYGENYEPRWSRVPGEEHLLYYHLNNGIYRQDPAAGYTSNELIVSPPSGYSFISSGAESDLGGGRYMTIKIGQWDSSINWYKNIKVGVVDLQTRAILPGMIDGSPDALEISPLGTWFFINHGTAVAPEVGYRMYRISDLAAGDTSKPVLVDAYVANGVQIIGHNGWAFDHYGNEVLFYQDSRNDHMRYFNPETVHSENVIGLAELGWSVNQHVGTIRNPAVKGWAFLSTYTPATDSWAYNQFMMIELLPKAEHPRIWRLGHTQNVYTGSDKNSAYFTEAFASIDDSGTAIYWGSNWNATDNLEVYRMDLGEDWWDTLPAVEPVVTPAPTPTPAPTALPLEVGATVQTDRVDLNVRETPNGAILGVAPAHADGLIQAGPETTGGYTWWQVTWSTELTGWSAQNWLTVIASAPTPTPTPEPTPTATPTPTPTPTPEPVSKTYKFTVSGQVVIEEVQE